MSNQKKRALFFTIAMLTGLVAGAFFNPVASIFGGFAGLYAAALITGKVKPDPSSPGHISQYNKAQDVAYGKVGLGADFGDTDS